MLNMLNDMLNMLERHDIDMGEVLLVVACLVMLIIGTIFYFN